MKTITFFEINSYEREIFTKNLSKYYNLIFNEYKLNSKTILSETERGSEIISVSTSSQLSDTVLKNFEKLEVISTRSFSFNHIDLKYCLEKNIKISNTPHYSDYSASEFSFALLLNLMRNICKTELNLEKESCYSKNLGSELYSKTIGIVGTGAIGSKAVKMAKGFSMEILAYDLFPNKDLINKYNVKYTGLDELCANSDIIMLHLPLNSESYHLINKSKISEMKQTAIVVNTSNGALIDAEALLGALKDGKLGGAALDVFENEEVLSNKGVGDNKININDLKISSINKKLMSLENVLATPHVSCDTKEATGRILDCTINNLIKYSQNLELIDYISY